ncbi:MAG: NAD(P)/FAD-dependent oxidoreductase [Nanoarchaeota archaeon]
MKYDLIIIGTGPAGLSAGVYAGRYKLKTLIIGSLPGGTASEAHKVCNFPSYEDITGFELMQKMIKQVKNLEINIKQEEVKKISGKNNNFKIKTNKQEYECKKIIYSTGSKRKKLGLKREEELKGKGISYCATCDAGFYKDKIAGVVGGGNAALTAALLLSKFAKKVYIFYRKPEFCKAEKAWIQDIEKNNKIEPIFNSNVKDLIGDSNLKAVKLDNEKTIELNGLFIEVGSIPQTKIAEKLGVKMDCEYIKTNKNQKTNIQGFFAAGDVTNNPLKQIITACGEGAIAGFQAYQEIEAGE